MRKILIFVTFCMVCLGTAYGNEIEKLVVLGGGPAGLTTALFAAQAHLEPFVIEGRPEDGQITSVFRLENYPGFPEGISGRELVGRIREQAEKFGARFSAGQAVEVNLLQYPFQIILEDGREVFCECLVVATGASPIWLGIESESAFIGRGISANAMLDAEQFKDQDVLVVGGGDAAMEQALFLTQHANHITIVYKEDQFYGAPYLQKQVLSHSKIDCLFSHKITNITEIEGQLNGVILQNLKTQKSFAFACQGIIVSNGRKPNTALFRNQLDMTEKGYIITKPDSSATNIPGVFAAGDITHLAPRKTITSVASGCQSASEVVKFRKQK